MSRSRSFSEDEIMERAASTFSAHGFHGTSMNLLADATGLGKQSLYNAFGDKQALYLQSVDCAVSKFAEKTQAMHTASNGYEALVMFFEGLIAACSHPDPGIHNCIVSAGLLEAVDEAAIRMSLLSKWQASHELLRSTIERGQRDGSIAATHPSHQLADLLMSMMSGLRVTARIDASEKRLAHTVNLLLASFKN
jgi:TetR/AcrR family transcriptional regulator, transcriptional repressor for nem operon